MKTVTLFLMCLLLAGCAAGNRVDVNAGQPFVAQAGLAYGIQENGPKYSFNPYQYPDAQVIYVEPGMYQRLQPGSVYVLMMDPTYFERVAANGMVIAELSRQQNETYNRMQERSRTATDNYMKQMDNTLNSFRGPMGSIDYAEQYRRSRQ